MPKYVTANPRKKIPSNTLGEIIEKSIRLNQESWVRACIIILWAYGIRIGELCKLRARDLSIRDGFLYINSVPSKNPSEPYRELPLSKDTPYFYDLISYINTLGKTDKILPMTHRTFERRLKEIDEELSPHVFRHWRGTQLSFSTDNPYEIMGWMGHSDIRTAVKYQHASGALAQRLGHKMRIK